MLLHVLPSALRVLLTHNTVLSEGKYLGFVLLEIQK